MKISTRGRYSIRLVADILQHQEEGYVSISSSADRQNLSRKYLEQLVTPLVKGGVLKSERGKDGGYKCTLPAEQIRVIDILNLTDNLMLVSCLKSGDPAAYCPHYKNCVEVGLWHHVHEMLVNYFSSVTMADLLAGSCSLPGQEI